jgi:hypothetical protein
MLLAEYTERVLELAASANVPLSAVTATLLNATTEAEPATVVRLRLDVAVKSKMLLELTVMLLAEYTERVLLSAASANVPLSAVNETLLNATTEADPEAVVRPIFDLANKAKSLLELTVMLLAEYTERVLLLAASANVPLSAVTATLLNATTEAEPEAVVRPIFDLANKAKSLLELIVILLAEYTERVLLSAASANVPLSAVTATLLNAITVADPATVVSPMFDVAVRAKSLLELTVMLLAEYTERVLELAASANVPLSAVTEILLNATTEADPATVVRPIFDVAVRAKSLLELTVILLAEYTERVLLSAASANVPF